VPDWVPVLTGSLRGLGAILNAILIYRRQGQTLGVSQEDSVTRRLQLDLDTLKGQIALYEAWVKGMSEQMIKEKDEYPWDIHTADSITAGIKAVAEWQPKIVVLDMMLKDGDGTSLLAAVHARPDWPHPPIVLATGTISQADERRMEANAAHLGAVRVLAKDDPQRVVNAVVEVAKNLYPLMEHARQ
jgi:CheY-like chemotaxis protein